MSVSMTKLEPFNVYEPFLQVIKEPLPMVLIWAVFAYIVFFLLKWILEPGKELQPQQRLEEQPAPGGRSAAQSVDHVLELVE